MIRVFRKWVDENNLVLIFITLYFLISIIKIQYPGVNNDQLMFVNTATLNPDNQFLWKSWHGIPMMIFPYIGALKSYLYMPIFHIFGVNIWSIRLPQIILISIAWFILYKVLLLAFDKKIALITLLFLSLDPSVIVYSKADQGPIVLEFSLKTLAVYFLFLLLKTKRSIFYLAIYPILVLGIFNKLNFIWFANAFLISFVIFYWKNFYNKFKRFDKLLPYLLFIVPYLLLIKFFLKLSRETSLSYKNFLDPVGFSNLFTNASSLGKNLVDLINGNLFFSVIYGYNPTSIGIFFSILILLILFLGGFLTIRKKLSSNYYFFASIVLLMIVQILLTKQAINPWHALSIYPFFTLLFAGGIIQIYGSIKLIHKNIFLFLIGTIIFYQMTINYIYISKYGQPTRSIAYSPAIYDLIGYAKKQNNIFICLDVDICNQLLAFDQTVGKYKEPFGFLDPDTYNNSFKKLGNYFNNPAILYVAHGNTNTHFPLFRENFFEYIKRNNISLRKIKEFMDGGSVAFEIYQVNIK